MCFTHKTTLKKDGRNFTNMIFSRPKYTTWLIIYYLSDFLAVLKNIKKNVWWKHKFDFIYDFWFYIKAIKNIPLLHRYFSRILLRVYLTYETFGLGLLIRAFAISSCHSKMEATLTESFCFLIPCYQFLSFFNLI